MVDARIDGARLRKVVASRAEAEEILGAWGVELLPQARATEAGPTLDEVSKEWLLWLEANARPATVTTAQECLDAIRRITPEIFGQPAMALTPSDVRRLKAGLAGRAPATQSKVLVRLKGMLAWAARPPEGEGRREGGGLLPRVPVFVRPPRVPKPSPATVAPRLVSDEFTCRILTSALDPRLRCALALARFCGLRRGEILRLRLGDIDLDGGVVRVLGPTKGHRARLAPLGPRGGEEVMRFLAQYDVPPGDRSLKMLLFPGWTASAVAQQMRRLARRVKWDTAKPGLHSLRATWASELLARGAPLHEVQSAGGWSSLAAMQHYLGAAPKALAGLARLC